MDESTLETSIFHGVDVELWPLCLTILAHPQVRRLGQQCLLRGRGPFVLSRTELEFGHPGGVASVLEDRHISRKPVRITPGPDGVLVTSDNDKARVLGRAIGDQGELLGPTIIDRGVVISLGKYAVVLLRRARPLEAAGELGMVGPSPELQLVRERVVKLARGDQPILISGPTGTGKELVARALHAHSARSEGPWIALNLAAIPASTAASQLFGHVRGAFTGAKTSSVGLFGEAGGGTLFLDEVGEADHELQPLLLRALESGEIQVVGGGVREVDVRVVAATDVDLEQAVASGRLRPALYHRLAGSMIVLTPLCERLEDAAAQLRHFMVEELRKHGREDKLDEDAWFSPRAQLEFVTHAWPGNTRQLRRSVEAMVLDCLDEPVARIPDPLRSSSSSMSQSISDSITSDTASQSQSSPGPLATLNPGSGRASPSSEELEQVLAATGYRLKPAAEQLGIAVNTLKSLMKRHGFRRAKDLDAADIEEARAIVGDEVEDLAAHLRVSAHALRLRLRELR